MRTVTRLAGFAVGLAAVFGTTYGIGRVVDRAPVVEGRHDGDGAHATGEHDETTDRLPGGLLVSDRGYTLEPVDAPADEFAFRIAGPDGQPVTRYDVAHDKQMHLIVARRDLSGFRHVHPELAAGRHLAGRHPAGRCRAVAGVRRLHPDRRRAADPRGGRDRPR